MTADLFVCAEIQFALLTQCCSAHRIPSSQKDTFVTLAQKKLTAGLFVCAEFELLCSHSHGLWWQGLHSWKASFLVDPSSIWSLCLICIHA